MALTQQERQGIITFLTANCDCWKQQGDHEVLNRFTDEKLVALKDHADGAERASAVANTAIRGFADDAGRFAYRINPDNGRWERKEMTANEPTYEEDEPDDSHRQERAPPPRRRPPMAQEPPPEEEEYVDEEEEQYAENRKRAMAGNARARTTDEWLRNAPPDVQNTYNTARQLEQREKDKVIAQLLVNVSESEKRAHRDRLQTRSLDDLYNDLNLIPKTPSPEEVNRAAGGVLNRSVGNARRPRNSNDDDMLVAPTLNFDEDGQAEVKTATTGPAANRDVGGYVDTDDDAWLQSAPATYRQAVQNALAIEAREKRRLIDDIVSNLDDASEKRMRGRLANKTLEELRDIQILSPKRQGSRPNYFGQSAPAANVQNQGAQDDILPLPKMEWGKKEAN